MADQEQTRFRSFAERYVIERASGFKSDTDAWTAVQDAMRVYKMIEQQSAHVSPRLDPTELAQKQPPNPTQVGAGGTMQRYKDISGVIGNIRTMPVAEAMETLANPQVSEKQKSVIRQFFGL